jgi:regulator of replication initiation timing
MGNVRPAPPLSVFQQMTIENLTTQLQDARSQVATLGEENTQLKEEVIQLKQQVQQQQTEIESLKFDLKVVLLKLQLDKKTTGT